MNLSYTIKKTLSAFLVLGTFGLSGCEQSTLEYSSVLHEDAMVINRVYTPESHGSEIRPKAYFNFDGELKTSFELEDVTIPEKYELFFISPRGKLCIECGDKKHKSLWSNVVEGQTVDISYRKVYTAVRDGTNIISKTFKRYDYLDAVPKTNLAERLE